MFSWANPFVFGKPVHFITRPTIDRFILIVISMGTWDIMQIAARIEWG